MFRKIFNVNLYIYILKMSKQNDQINDDITEVLLSQINFKRVTDDLTNNGILKGKQPITLQISYT